MTINSKYKKYANSITYRIEAKEIDYLYILESQIPNSGKGLFTAIPIYKDEIISVFKGELLTKHEAQFRASKGHNGYFITMPDGATYDSMNVHCFAKYANDAVGVVQSRFKINSKIKLDDHGRVCIVASKKIVAGEEIFCSYGNKYWEKYFK
jgi:SET domain-containing protein